MLVLNQHQKSDKASFITYADLECFKNGERKNNPENSFTTKVGEHILSGFSMSTISPFKNLENKHDLCRGKDCMKSFIQGNIELLHRAYII